MRHITPNSESEEFTPKICQYLTGFYSSAEHEENIFRKISALQPGDTFALNIDFMNVTKTKYTSRIEARIYILDEEVDTLFEVIKKVRRIKPYPEYICLESESIENLPIGVMP